MVCAVCNCVQKTVEINNFLITTAIATTNAIRKKRHFLCFG